MIQYQCPSCGTNLLIDDKYRGQKGRCKSCGQTIRVPSEGVVSSGQSAEGVVDCPFCGEEILVAAKKCKHCGEWLSRTSVTPETQVANQPTKSSGDFSLRRLALAILLGVGIFVVIFISMFLPIAFDSPPDSAESLNENVQHAAVASRQPQSSITKLEWTIHDELMAAPVSESEDSIRARLARKYSKTPEEIKDISWKVLNHDLYGGGDADSKQRIRAALSSISGIAIRDLIVSQDFANVSYIEKEPAWREKDVERIVLERVPTVLSKIFDVERIGRIQLIVFYPAQGGGEAKAATIKVSRSEYAPHKSAAEYQELWTR